MLPPMTKHRPTGPPAVKIVAANVARLLAASYGPRTQKDLRARAGIAQSTVSRILRGNQGAGIDVVEQIAHAYGLEAWQLMVPGFDPANPPILRSMSEQETQLYERLRALSAEFARLPKQP